MATQALYLSWRPMTFEDVVGQEHITFTLRNALVSGRVGHAYLFSGLRGTGKTSMARLLAKAVNCLDEDPARRPCNECANCLAVNEARFLDLIEIDAASHTGVDDVRDLRDRIAFSPNEGRYKVYIIDEVHRFSGSAFDALLKTIEEPPAHAIFVLATTEIHKVPQTILSRCQRFDFRRLSLIEISGRLGQILDHEGVQADDDAVELIARQATGSMRDAISLLEQLITDRAQVLTLELAQAILGTADRQAVADLTDAILVGNIAAGLEIIDQAMGQGTDARQFANQMVEHLRRVMLLQTGGVQLVELEVMPAEVEIMDAQAQDYPRRALLEAIKQFREAASDTTSGWQPQLPLEMALVESVEALYATQDVYPAPAQPAQPRQQAAPPRQAAPEQTPVEQQPVEQPPAEVVEEAPAEPPAISLADVNARWRDVLAVARKRDKTIGALLNSGKLYSVEGTTIIYRMPSDILRDKIEGEENQQIIEEVLARVFSQPLKLRCTTKTGKSSRQSDDVSTLVAGDSVLSYAVNELGGSVKPIEDEEE